MAMRTFLSPDYRSGKIPDAFVDTESEPARLLFR